MTGKPASPPGEIHRWFIGQAGYPAKLCDRLREHAPAEVFALGNLDIMNRPRTAILCSSHAPGNRILQAHDTASRLRDAGVTLISGFHSPIESDCLNILLRGKQPIIICPARSLIGMRIPKHCQDAFEAGRILFLSPFSKEKNRATRELALQRNDLVASLADEAFLLYVVPDVGTAMLEYYLKKWRVPTTLLGS